MTNPTMIQNFTTPAKLLSNHEFLGDLRERLLLVFSEADKGFISRDEISEADFRFVMRTTTNLVHTGCESQKLKNLLDSVEVEERVVSLLSKYCQNVESVQRNCLMVSEILAFCCASITTYFGVNWGNNENENPRPSEDTFLRFNQLINSIHPYLDVMLQGLCSKYSDEFFFRMRLNFFSEAPILPSETNDSSIDAL